MNFDDAPLSESTSPPPDSKPGRHPGAQALPGAKKKAAPDVQVNVNNTVNEGAATSPAPREQPQARPSPGLPFSAYRRLAPGMSEGEVLAIAGPPDRKTVDARNTHDGFIQKSYYYTSTGYNAFVTRIRFLNGRVVRLDRTPVLP